MFLLNGSEVTYNCEHGKRLGNELAGEKGLKCNFYDRYGNITIFFWLQSCENQVYKNSKKQILGTSEFSIITKS